MPDMFVKLYQLPDVSAVLEKLKTQEITIRRPMAYEKHVLINWIEKHYGIAWASECEMAFTQHPISCFIAQHKQEIVGFSCYESTAKNFFGPMAVQENMQGIGVGKVLLITALSSMRESGYAYAVIGGVGPVEYYERVVGAEIISGSEEGVYPSPLVDSQ